MIKYMDFSGKTEEDAIETGLKTLGLERDDVSVEIVERSKSGFLGIGSSAAVVRLSFEAPDEEKVPNVESARPAKPAKAEKVPQPKPIVNDEKYAEVESFISGLLERMGIEAQLEITGREKGGINVNLTGQNMGSVIGRRGETLDAIQHLTNYSVNRGTEKRLHISVDAENYRKKREDSLVALAEKMAAKAVKYRRSMALEPMNSYERHVIHSALSEHPDVTTSSTGTEPRRRVVVSYSKEQTSGDNKPKSREWH